MEPTTVTAVHSFHKAAPIGVTHVNNLELHFKEPMPDEYKGVPPEATLKMAQLTYYTEADQIASLLQKTLPQGTFHRLAVEMLSKIVSSFKGPGEDLALKRIAELERQCTILREALDQGGV